MDDLPLLTSVRFKLFYDMFAFLILASVLTEVLGLRS